MILMILLNIMILVKSSNELTDDQQDNLLDFVNKEVFIKLD